MKYKVESLVRVAMAGGSLTVNGDYSIEDLVRIAMAIRAKGVGILTVKAPDIPVEGMARVAIAAPGRVVFELA